MPVERFKSKEAYRRYNAYTHIHGIPTHAKEVVVGGKRHTVKHSEKKETAEMEAKEHSKGFLKKAAKLADKKLGKGKRSRKVRGKRMAKKGY